MNRKFKLFFSLASLCLSVAMLCFGVYSAMSVSYTVNGSVSYEVSGVYVNIDTTLYMSTLTTLTGDSSLGSKVSEFETQLKSNGSASVSDTANHSYNYEYSSYSEESGFNAETNPKSDNIPINYGSYIEDQTAYAYYIIVKIENIAENKINAVLDLGDTSMLNSYVKPNMTQTNIDANSTQYFVIGMSLKDATIGVNETFNYHITITPGELQEPTLYQLVGDQYISQGEIPVDSSLTITANNAVSFDFSAMADGAELQVFNYRIDNFYPKTPFIDITSLQPHIYNSGMFLCALNGNYSSDDSEYVVSTVLEVLTSGSDATFPVSTDGTLISSQEIYDSYCTSDGTLEFAIVWLSGESQNPGELLILQIGFRGGEYQYTLNEDDTYTAEYVGKEKSIEVPTEYQGKKVTSFKIETNNMDSIIVPEGIKNVSISNHLTSGCTFNEVSLPTTIESIELDTTSSTSMSINIKINLNDINDWQNEKYDILRYYFSDENNYNTFYGTISLYVNGVFVQDAVVK